MRVVGVHHVQLAMPTGGEDRAVAFYQGLLGVPRVRKPSHLEVRGGCWFESNTVRIHLGVDPNFRPAKKAHLALLAEDLSAVKEKLIQAGVAVVVGERLPGFERFYAHDPFGNRIEFLEPAAPKLPG
jgi:catechol 2,3-dioxygenase-like lactoylglutathione lyase family enzyme